MKNLGKEDISKGETVTEELFRMIAMRAVVFVVVSIVAGPAVGAACCCM